MKSWLAFILISIAWASCHQADKMDAAGKQQIADTANYTSIKWLDSLVNIGSIQMGEQVKVVFRFRNTGTKPLFLANVKAGCGCTVPDYTHGAIAPGAEGVVTGAFDTNKSYIGAVRKNIFVISNTRNRNEHTLIFTGVIKDKIPAQ